MILHFATKDKCENKRNPPKHVRAEHEIKLGILSETLLLRYLKHTLCELQDMLFSFFLVTPSVSTLAPFPLSHAKTPIHVRFKSQHSKQAQ